MNTFKVWLSQLWKRFETCQERRAKEAVKRYKHFYSV